MAKSAKDEFTMEVKEFIGVLKESDKHDWCKAVARISWNGNPTTLDIRSMNMAKMRAGKGISLSDEEADRLLSYLLDNDYGTLDSLQAAVKRKTSRFTIGQNELDDVDEDNPLIIDINL